MMSFANSARMNAEDIKLQYYAQAEDYCNDRNYIDNQFVPITPPTEQNSHQLPPDICYPDYPLTSKFIDENLISSSPYISESNKLDKDIYFIPQDLNYPNDFYDNSFEPVITEFNEYLPIYEDIIKDLEEKLYQKEIMEKYSKLKNSEQICNGDLNNEILPDTGMEETFRRALLQYFSQVDKEKEGLVGDLKKLKEDFQTYLAEGKKNKLENIHQAKIIRKLTENGKLFVQEIEKLKAHLKKLEQQRVQLIKENNDLQRKITYENDIIPHLEKEMKNLAEENQFLKLLAEDTKQLEQQEQTIRNYTIKIEEQERVNQKYSTELKKQASTISHLSRTNADIKHQLQELSNRQADYDLLKETEKQHNQLLVDFKRLSHEKQLLENQSNGLHCTIKQLEQEVNQMKNAVAKLKQKHIKEHEENKEKGSTIQELKEKNEELIKLHELDIKELKDQESSIRNLTMELVDVSNGNKTLHEEIKSLNMKNEALICEDEIRTKNYEYLLKNCNELEKQYSEISKKLKKAELELHEKDISFNELQEREERNCIKLNELKKDNEKYNDEINNLEIKCRQLKDREKDLENEILDHVKNTSEMEQEVLLTSKTMETLKKCNDHSAEQRSNLQKELLVLQSQLKRFETEKLEREILQKEKNNEFEILKEKYGNCEGQKNRLQKDILQIQDKLNKSESKVAKLEIVEENYTQIKEQYQKIFTKNEELQSELIYMKDQNNILVNEVKTFEELKYKLDEAENEKLDLQKEKLFLKEKMSQFEEKLENCDQLNETMKNYKSKNSSLQLENDSLKNKLEKSENRNREMMSLRTKIQEHKTKKLELIEENIQLKEKIHQLETQVTELMRDGTSSTMETLNNPPPLDKSYKSQMVQLDSKIIEVHNIEDEVLKLKEKLKVLENIEREKKSAEEKSKNLMRKREIEIQELTEYIKILEEDNKSKSHLIEEDIVHQFKSEIRKLNNDKRDLEKNIEKLISKDANETNLFLADENQDLKKQLHNVLQEKLYLQEVIDELKSKQKVNHSFEIENETGMPTPIVSAVAVSEREVLPLINDKEKLNETLDSTGNTLDSKTCAHFETDDVSIDDVTIINTGGFPLSSSETNSVNQEQNKHKVMLENSNKEVESKVTNKDILNDKRYSFENTSLLNYSKNLNKEVCHNNLLDHSNTAQIETPGIFLKNENSFLCSSDVEINIEAKKHNESKLNGDKRLFTKNVKNESLITSDERNHLQSTIDYQNQTDEIYDFNNLKVENKNLHEDIDNLLDDYKGLQNHLKVAENIIKDKNDEIEELFDKLNVKNSIIEDLEIFIGELQFELEGLNKKEDNTTSTDSIDKQDFKEILSSKNELIAELEVHNQKLKYHFDKNHQDIEQLRNELREYKFLHCQNIQDANSFKNRSYDKLIIPNLPNTSDSLDPSQKPIFSLPQNENKEIASFESKEEKFEDKDNQIKNLKNRNRGLSEILQNKEKEIVLKEAAYQDLLEIHQQGNRFIESPSTRADRFLRTVNLSEDEIENYSKEAFHEIKLELSKKEELIEELQQYIKLVQEEFKNSKFSDEDLNQMERNLIPSKQPACLSNLTLPQPNQTNINRTRCQRPTAASLKPILKHSNQCSNKDFATNEEVSYDELKRKLISLNAELLQKKIDMNKVEDELIVSKRKQNRAEESYRNLVAKNESLEHEILENRRKIQEVQARQVRNESTDSDIKNELRYYRGCNSSSFSSKCSSSSTLTEKDEFQAQKKANHEMQKRTIESDELNNYRMIDFTNNGKMFEQNYKDQIEEQDELVRRRPEEIYDSPPNNVCSRQKVLEQQFIGNLIEKEHIFKENKESVKENNGIKHETEILKLNLDKATNENRYLRKKNEKIKHELDEMKKNKTNNRDEADDLKRAIVKMEDKLKSIAHDKQILKDRYETQLNNNKELKRDNETCNSSVKEYNELNEKLKAALNICKNERNIFEIQTKEKVKIIEELKVRLTEVKEDRAKIQTQKEQLESVIETNELLKRNLVTEKEMSDHNTRYMETKIDEFKSELKKKDEALQETQSKQNESIARLNAVTNELECTNNELKRVKKKLDEEIEKYNKLGKISDDMNLENKRLMHELTSFKQSMESIELENRKHQDKIQRLEKEEGNLDNLLVKTQKSNSELLENNQILNKEIHKLRSELKSVEDALNNRVSENSILKKNVETLTSDMDNKTKNLLDEKETLLNELNMARKTINEFEAILDQGQMDFDDLETQLENYRHENINLDHKLHEVLKIETILKSENDEYMRQLNELNKEITKLQEENNEINNRYKETVKIKEEIEYKNQEYKTRDEYFEERLKGFENIIKTKDDLLKNDKNDRGNLQNNILQLQSDLFHYKNLNEQLSNEKESANKELAEKSENIKSIEKSNIELLKCKNELNMELTNKGKELNELEFEIKVVKKERSECENNLQITLEKLSTTENELENEKLKNHQEKEELLTEISCLKRKINEKELIEEKQQYQQLTNETEYDKLLEINEELTENLTSKEKEYENEKSKLINEIKDLNLKVKLYEEEKEEEHIKFREIIEDMEETRERELTILQEKFKEYEDFKELINESENAILEKNNEIENLKEDIRQLQSNIESFEIKIEESQETIETLNTQILYLEKDNNSINLDKEELLSTIKEKEEIINEFEKVRNEEEHKNLNLQMEKEKLEKSYEVLIEEKDTHNRKYLEEIKSLKEKIEACDAVRYENERLKSEIKIYRAEKQGLEERVSHSNQLQTEVFDLRGKAERVQELLQEIQQLKQDLLNSETRHNATIEKLQRDNSALKRQKDELLKKIQDLDLRNVNFVRTNPRDPKFSVGSLPLKQKATDAANENAFETESFSPMKHGIATSTPTQENTHFFSSVNVTRQTPSNLKLAFSSESSSIFPKLPANLKDELNSRPTIQASQIIIKEPVPEKKQNIFGQIPPFPPASTANMSVIETQRNDDSPFSSSIKFNPFLQMDKSRIAKTPPAFPKSLKPGNQRHNLSLESFDMRPKSTDTGGDNLDEDSKSSKRNSYGVGNEFVSRLKAAFETK